MPEIRFRVDGAEAGLHTAAPLLLLHLRVTNTPAIELIHSIALQCQVRIDAPRRRYDGEDFERHLDLFGEPSRWGQTVRSLLWTHVSVNVPSFKKQTHVDLPIPCTYDLNVATTKYFHGLDDGSVPLTLLFSGTVFYTAPSGALQVSQIPWEREAQFQLRVETWKDMMERFFPGSGWLTTSREVLDRLYRYRSRNGYTSWEEAFDCLLDAAERARA